MSTEQAPRQHQRGAAIPYAEVARIVREWPTPAGFAPHIAALYGVPYSTAQRWVLEARRRGHLPENVERPCPRCDGTGVVKYGPKSGPKRRSR